MIRIDLGKGGLEEKSPIAKKLAALNIPPQVVARLQKLTADIGTIITIIVAVALSLLFPLVGKQYRTALIMEHDARMKEMNQKLALATSEIGKYTHYKQELESYNNQKNLVTNRLQAVKTLLDSRGTPVNVLDSLGQSLPSRTWYNSIEMTLGETGSVNIAGSSYSNEEISDLVEKLNESIYLSEISLEEVGTKREDNVDYRSFIITAKPKTKITTTAGG